MNNKGGDIVYNHSYTEGLNRQELNELLCDAIEYTLDTYKTDRISNGFIADTIFRFLDVAVTGTGNIKKLESFMDSLDDRGT